MMKAIKQKKQKLEILIENLLGFGHCKVFYSASTLSSVSLNEDLALELAPLSQNQIINRHFCKSHFIDHEREGDCENQCPLILTLTLSVPFFSLSPSVSPYSHSHPQCPLILALTLSVSLFWLSPSVSPYSDSHIQCALILALTLTLTVPYSDSHPQCLLILTLTLSVSLFWLSPSVSPYSYSHPQCPLILTLTLSVPLFWLTLSVPLFWLSPSVSPYSDSHPQCPLILTRDATVTVNNRLTVTVSPVLTGNRYYG